MEQPSSSNELSSQADTPVQKGTAFWNWGLVKWGIRGYGKDGYLFRLLLYPLIGVFVAVAVLLKFEQLRCAVALSVAMTFFLGLAGYRGAKRELLVSSAKTRAVVKARTKRAAERLSSIGVVATVLAIFTNATSVSSTLYSHTGLDGSLKDTFAMFVALVFLPVYVSGAARKLATAQIDEFEALQKDTTGVSKKRNKKGDVESVIVVGPSTRLSVPINVYMVLEFAPVVEKVPDAANKSRSRW